MARSVPCLAIVPQERFSHRETHEVLALVDQASDRSGVGRRQAFDDLLTMGVCALSGGSMEEEYLATVARHTAGAAGKRGCDSLAQAFAKLIEVMETTRQDTLGDLFQGAISRGERGQFFTPPSLCEAMARMTLAEVDEDAVDRRRVLDPCCGSGRMLLAVGKLQPTWELWGQDVEISCVRMTTLNLALYNLGGGVIWGDSLTDRRRSAYRTGFNGRGFVRKLDESELALVALPVAEAARASTVENPTSEPSGAMRQLRLF